MDRLKLILSIFFLLIGLTSAFLTYNLSNKDSLGNIESSTPRSYNPNSIVAAGSGVDSSNDGVAVGFGIRCQKFKLLRR